MRRGASRSRRRTPTTVTTVKSQETDLFEGGITSDSKSEIFSECSSGSTPASHVRVSASQKGSLPILASLHPSGPKCLFDVETLTTFPASRAAGARRNLSRNVDNVRYLRWLRPHRYFRRLQGYIQVALHITYQPTMSTAQAHLLLAPDGESSASNVPVNSDAVQLDALGPMVVNSDGTLSRIANWQQMTDAERERTMRVLAARNKIRIARQEKATGEPGSA